MRIVFMGTPDFAAVVLNELISAGHDIACVCCQPDKPVGRKQVLTAPPVKALAESAGLPVFQPKSLRDGEAYKKLKEINPELIVVAAYGKILPPEMLSLPKYGCINCHASLLPRFRGASPIQWAIVSGDTVTGVTIMQMDTGMDTGDILMSESVAINEDETAGELFDRLAITGARLTASAVTALEKGLLTPQPQPENGVTYAPIIKKEMALLDFTKPAAELRNLIRGFNPWPCAYFYLEGKRVRVLSAAVGEPSEHKPGTVTGNNGTLDIACGGGVLRLLEVQPDGGKPMSAKQLLCGWKISVGTVIAPQSGV